MIKFITFICGTLLGASLMAQSMPSTTPHLQGASQMGQSRLRFIVHVYDAALYAPAGFKAENPFAQAMALAVAPGRAFRAESILKQIVKELKRQDLPEATIVKYESEFAAVLPAVEEGDTLTGVFTPKQGWALWFKGKRIGQWADEAFAKAFFNIWLGANASQAVVRSELLKLPQTASN
jgi:Chalcone isomerase-like